MVMMSLVSWAVGAAGANPAAPMTLPPDQRLGGLAGLKLPLEVRRVRRNHALEELQRRA
jgi:hypothetical protein